MVKGNVHVKEYSSSSGSTLRALLCFPTNRSTVASVALRRTVASILLTPKVYDLVLLKIRNIEDVEHEPKTCTTCVNLMTCTIFPASEKF